MPRSCPGEGGGGQDAAGIDRCVRILLLSVICSLLQTPPLDGGESVAWRHHQAPAEKTEE